MDDFLLKGSVSRISLLNKQSELHHLMDVKILREARLEE
jgi:hypothetical protein